MLKETKAELSRLSADKIQVEYNPEFEPEAGELVKITLEDAYWHMQPQPFLELLKELADDAGSEAVREAIERHGHPVVYRGPEPEGNRDT
jgi:hypothetical protein